VSVVVGGPSLRAFADTLAYLDLSSPPPSVSVVTLVGSSELDRLGIWVRTGDVDDDGIADMVIGADQANHGTSHTGEVYVVRGGSHLAATQTLDMAQFGTGAFGGNVMRITGPTAAGDGHFGATCLIGDVDGNGKSEVLASTTLSRVSAGIRPVGATDSAHSTGGFAPGILWIAWDDNFPATPWPAAFEFSVDAPPATLTRIIGPNGGGRFGEELFTGLDLDASGSPDLFVGDLQSDNTLGSNRVRSGSGHVFWESDELRTGNLDLRTPPPGFVFSVIVGPHTGAIGGDTAAAGDFDGDGIDDLVFAAPDDSPDGRIVAGSVYVLFGREGGWPTYVDTAPGEIPPPEMVRVVWVKGANFTIGSNLGDILGYSAACGDINGDGLSELILNEMGGDAVSPEMEDVGTLLLIGGRTVTGQSMTAVGVQLR
jgi:hypothetical protein